MDFRGLWGNWVYSWGGYLMRAAKPKQKREIKINEKKPIPVFNVDKKSRGAERIGVLL